MITTLEKNRYNKLEQIAEKTNPYPDRFQRSHELKDLAALDDGVDHVRVAGRILFIRNLGKMSFVRLNDIEGQCQIAVRRDVVGDEAYETFAGSYDIGDFMGVEGETFTTRTGEKTIRAAEIHFLGKALRPLPEKFHGITDIESCYRQRYLDLTMNQATRDRFLLKIEFVKSIRRYLEDQGYMELETPILIDHPSGATAKPFTSYHNALAMDVHLRIAPETYLKRAVVGGFTKVFEFARCFRNEGIDATHLQDFTMLEGYCAYFNHRDNMAFLKEMLTSVVTKLFGVPEIDAGGQVIDFAGDWPVVTFRELILKDSGIDIQENETSDALLAAIKGKGLALGPDAEMEKLGRGNLMDLLYKKVSRPKLISPTFLTDHPKAISPLARAKDDNEDIVDRFQLVINGAEVINAYSELVDPVDQRQRLEDQARLKAGGDEEAMVMDHDYIRAMEYGMPPISGWGMGIDRMLQVLTGEDNIKNMVMFPLMRPQ